ncbi:MAG: indole-3-glycerol phosphate synthase TrpC [Bacteroidetes bacterium]|nr:indole-3-glycerol phosphate synthase TrpC [Bacteroidota bacterium]
MNILDKIVAQKKIEIEISKQQHNIAHLEKTSFFIRPTFSLTERITQTNSSGIIAEFKKKSPSKGIINDNFSSLDIVPQYEQAGVAGSSVLTDEMFFGGSKQDLSNVRDSVNIPLLRKDFMIDEYQFVEAKAIGADVVLLIAAILSPQQVKQFTDLAKSLNLQVLLELHDEQELNHVYHKVDMIGINNRNLKTFEVDIEQSIRMANTLGNDFVKVAESGISNIETLLHFRKNGFQGFLIGENFMKNEQPGLACKEFIELLRSRNAD